MKHTFIQLDIFNNQIKKRIFKRGFNGQFKSTEPTELEKLQRENFQLKNKNEELERKVLALVKYQRIILTQNNNKL